MSAFLISKVGLFCGGKAAKTDMPTTAGQRGTIIKSTISAGGRTDSFIMFILFMLRGVSFFHVLSFPGKTEYSIIFFCGIVLSKDRYVSKEAYKHIQYIIEGRGLATFRIYFGDRNHILIIGQNIVDGRNKKCIKKQCVYW